MSDDDNRLRDTLFKWGVSAKPLAGKSAGTGGSADDAQPKPPRGGTAVFVKKRTVKKRKKLK